jgi:hypothetical protein
VTRALQKDPDKVLEIAKKIQEESPRPDSKTAFYRMIGRGSTVLPPRKTKVEIWGHRGETGSFNVDGANKTVSIIIKNIDPEKAMKLRQLVTNALSSSR